MNDLGVNIDHVATIRQARGADEPDPVWAAAQAELGGADCITFHLREDRRHISDRDAELLRRTVATKLNMEMAAVPEIVEIALRLQPAQVTLVPERRQERTTEGGLNVAAGAKALKPVIQKLRDAGIVVSAFIEPETAQVQAAHECGVDSVELWTGRYAHARPGAAQREEVERLCEAGAKAAALELSVLAGHGLTYRNVSHLAELGTFDEFNIGHSIVSRAVLVGMQEAVREMKRLLVQGRHAALAMAQLAAVHHEHTEDEEQE